MMKISKNNQKQQVYHNGSLSNILKILALALMAVLIFGCSKDDDGGNPTPTEQLRLKTYTRGATETNFSYNSDNFLNSWVEGTIASNVIYDSENRPIQVGRTSYTYNSLARISGMTKTDEPTYVYASNFIYNNEGLIASYDFFNGYLGDSHITFMYNANNQMTTMTDKKISSLLDCRFLFTYDGNGNISQFKRQNSSDGGTTFTDAYTKTYTYDDKRNPSYELLKSLGITSNLSFMYLPTGTGNIIIGDIPILNPQFYSPNNLLTYTSNSGGGTTFSYEYVYNEASLPTSVEITKNDGTVTYESWIYETVTE